MTFNRPVFLALAIVVFAFLPWIGLHGVFGSSEAREAHMIALLCGGSDWVLPLRNGLVPSKPIFFHWIGAGFCSWGLPPLISARLVSLLSASIILILTVRLAGRFAAPPNRHHAQIFALVVLSTTYLFLNGVLDARVDMFFSLWVAAACSVALTPLADSTQPAGTSRLVPTYHWTLFWLFCGLAVLAKGPLGLALPALVVALSYGATFGFARTVQFLLTPVWGWLIFLSVALPWYVLAARQGGGDFVGRQIIFENIRRLLGGEFVNSQPWYFYFPQFLSGTAPWSVLFLLSIAYAWSKIRDSNQIYQGRHFNAYHGRVVLLIWIFAGLALFSFASGKRSSYLLPLMPAFAAWLGCFLSDYWSLISVKGQARWRKFIDVASFACVVFGFSLVLLLAFGMTPGLWDAYGYSEIYHQLKHVLAYAFLFLALVLGAVLAIMPRWTIFHVLFSFCIWLGFAVKAELKDFESMAHEISSHVPMDTKLTVIRSRTDEYFDPILFLLGRGVNLQSPEVTFTDCSGYFLHRASSDLNTQCPCSKEQLLSEWYDRLSGKKTRELALSLCRAQ